MTQKEAKLELATWMCKHNRCLITGSMMLEMRGIDLGRESSDVDLVTDVSSWSRLVLPPFAKRVKVNPDYKDTSSTFSFEVQGIKVDVLYDMSARDELDDVFNITRLASVDSLLRAKYRYVESGSKNSDKHRKDIKIIESYIGKVKATEEVEVSNCIQVKPELSTLRDELVVGLIARLPITLKHKNLPNYVHRALTYIRERYEKDHIDRLTFIDTETEALGEVFNTIRLSLECPLSNFIPAPYKDRASLQELTNDLSLGNGSYEDDQVFKYYFNLTNRIPRRLIEIALESN